MTATRLMPLGQFYKDPKFIKLMNDRYFPATKVMESAAKLRQLMGDEWVKKLRWGEYQTKLVEGNTWPGNTYSSWVASVNYARSDLAAQPNEDPVSRANQFVPKNKCDLLDECVRTCFNTVVPGQKQAGIPMVIDVRVKPAGDPAAGRHDIWLSWTYDPNGADDVPRQLNLTMVCPSPAARRSRTRPARKAVRKAPAKAKKAAKKAPAKAKKTARKATRRK